MLKEFLEYVSEQATKAAKAELTHSPSHQHDLLILKPDGTVQEMTVPPTPRAHVAGDLETIFEFADRFHPDGTVSVWYGRKGITLIVDDDVRRDRVCLPFDVSPQLKQLQAFEATPRPLSQSEFGRLLRVTFADCLARCPELPQVVKRIKFRVGSESDAAVSHTRSSIGRSLEAEVTGASAIPEYVEFDVPVFSHPKLPWTALVRCGLEADAGTEKFVLLPLPGATERAVASGEDALHERLIESLADKAEVYRGTP